MYIPFSTRIPIYYSVGFAITLCSLQMLEGTSLNFSLLSFAFIFVATVAFNVAGGFSRASGSYIFFYSLFGVIIGLTYKAYLGEPADTNLAAPQTTMLVYVAGITGMLAATYITKACLPRKGLLDNLTTKTNMQAASIGCYVIGFGIFASSVITAYSNSDLDSSANNSGTLLSALGQVNKFLPLGIILGVTSTIIRSNGKRFLSIPVLVASIASIVVFGIVGDSKQGLFEPILCVMIAAAARRYRFSVGQTVVFLLAMLFAFYYLVPFIQLRKGTIRPNSFIEEIGDVYVQMFELGDLRQQANTNIQQSYEVDDYYVHYFDSPQGIFDRLQMISVDDALVDVTEQGEVFGLSPLLYDVYNLVPHFIWHDKPTVELGNVYMHEITQAHYSQAGEGDDTTGISFSPSADAFHMAKWTGVLVIAPVMWFACFFVIDYVGGDTRTSPWGLLLVALCSHIAPEGMMGGAFYLLTTGPLTIMFIAILARYALPIFGDLFNPSSARHEDQRRPWRTQGFLRVSSQDSEDPPAGPTS